MLKQSLLYLILTKYLISSALNNLNGVTDISELEQIDSKRIKCILKVFRKNVPCGRYITAVTAGNHFDNIVLKTLSNEHCYALITRTILRQNWLLPTEVYLIVLKDSYELSLSLFELSRDVLWNPGAKFIIFVHSATDDNIRQIFNELLKHRIYNALFLSSEDFENIRGYVYFPFDDNNCGKRYNDIVILGDCNNNANSDTLILRDHLVDYRECLITVGIHEAVPYVVSKESTGLNVSDEYKFGIEQFIVESVAELEGVKIEYKYFSSKFDRGVVLANNTSTGMLSYLQSGEISLAIGGFILILNRVSLCDYIWGFNYADLKIVASAASEIVWKKVYEEFSMLCWILISCSFCIVSLATLLILKYSVKKRQDSINIMLKLLDYLLDHSDDSLFRQRNLRLLLLYWIWYTYFIISFYKTAYYSLITGHVKEKPKFEPRNLNKFSLEPCLSEDGRSFFIYAYNLTFPYKKKIEGCQSTDSSLNYVIENHDYYTVTTEYSYYLKAPNYIDGDGNFGLDSWNMLSGTISALYCTRGFGLRKRFQEHAMNIFESGLLQFRLNMMKVQKGHLTQNNKRYFKSLHFSDFRISYYILCIGYIISLVVFLFERYY